MIKLLIPDLPSADELLPLLRAIDASRIYVNGGPLVTTFESLLARVCGAPAACVVNATIGLELALRSLDLKPGARVLVPAMTFAASGLAIRNAGLEPVLADVDAKTWQLDPTMVFDALNDDPALDIDAVMPVAAFGAPVPVMPWDIFALNTGKPVVIDAAGALTEQEAAGHPLVTTVYSMHATKFFGCGEGGVVSSCDAARVARIREMAAFGPGGTNAKLSEYHAAVGLAQFRRLETKHVRTMAVYDAYARHLPEELVDGEQLRGKAIGNHTLMNVLLPAWCGAAQASAYLLRNDIETRTWYRPFLNERQDFAHCQRLGNLPATEMLAHRLLGLPFHTSLTAADVSRVCACLVDLLATNG